MRILVVVNEAAGAGSAGLYEFVRLVGLEGPEIVVRYVTDEKRAEALVEDVTSFDRLVAVGGDGTASAILYAGRSKGVPTMIYPAGTANLLASNLGMPTDSPALRAVLLGENWADFDLGELEYKSADGAAQCSGFVLMAGAGYDAAIMQTAEPLKATLGAAAYFVAAVSNLAPTVAEFTLRIDGERIDTDGIAVLLANFSRIQFDLPVTPGTDPRDGRLEVGVIRTKNVVGLIPAVAAAMLDRVSDHPDRSASIDIFSGRTIEVDADPPLTMQSDGDAIDARTPFVARILPRATRLLLPVDSPYAST